jgi:hypothetical protein
MPRVFKSFSSSKNFLQPSKTVTVSAGDSESIELAGRGNQRLGFEKIMVTDDGAPNDILLDAEPTAGGFTFFEDIQAGAITEFFRHRLLQSPLVLDEDRNLEVTITNTDSTAHEVTVELQALPEPELKRRIKAVREKFEARLVPVFLYVTGEVPAGSTVREDLLSYRTETELIRFMVEIDDQDEDNTTFDIRLPRETPIRDKRKSTVLQQFTSGELPQPLEINTRKEAQLVVDNIGGSGTSRFTFLGECYSLPGGPLIQ